MRPFLIPVALLSTTVSSQLVVPFLQDAPVLRRFLPSLDRNQVPLMDPAGPGPAMPPSAPGESPSDSKGGVRLSDVMGRDRSMNLFAGYVHYKPESDIPLNAWRVRSICLPTFVTPGL